MPLINCPECQREISDTVQACPHCGYVIAKNTEQKAPQKVEIAAVSLKPKDPAKLKKTLVTIVAAILVCVVGSTALMISSRRKARNEYIDNLNELASSMILGAGMAESLCDLTAQVWRDAIYKEYHSSTAKYTIITGLYDASRTSYSEYLFVSDFNTALAKLFADADTTSKIDAVKANKALVGDIMKKLNNPTSEFEKCYATVEELFGAYSGLTELAVNPSGNLQTFSQNEHDRAAKFLEYYERLETQIPEKK